MYYLLDYLPYLVAVLIIILATIIASKVIKEEKYFVDPTYLVLDTLMREVDYDTEEFKERALKSFDLPIVEQYLQDRQ